MTNRTLPTHAEVIAAIRTELTHFSTDALNAQLDALRSGRVVWDACLFGTGDLEVEIICELKVRAANAKLEALAHV